MSVSSKQIEAKGGRADDPIGAYARAHPGALGDLCEAFRETIDTALPQASSKVWHGSPVWFIGENPVVGYSVSKKGVALLFWNGRAFNEPGLEPVGKYGAAQATFSTPDAVDPVSIRRWLDKAGEDVFDSKSFFKRLREAK